jgi:hypothetical protein
MRYSRERIRAIFEWHEGSMADDFSILPQWKRLLPAEKVGNMKEGLVGQVEKEIPQRNRKRRKGQAGTSDADPEKTEGAEESTNDSKVQSGKIVDITI